MIKKITESVVFIHLSPNDPLTLDTINKALLTAMSNRMYAKFYTDKWWIQVNFMKDNTINVSTNIRLQSCINDLWKKSQYGWTFSLVKSFVYQWLSVYRKLLS